MRPIAHHWAISVTVTPRCHKRCAHCTRGVRQVPFHDAPLEAIETAIKSLEGWGGGVACLGGEPTLHPHFHALCGLWQKHVDRWRSALFTCRDPFGARNNIAIKKTFGIINYNDHFGGSWHQPLFVTAADLGISEEERIRRRDRCWLHWHWCPEVKPGVGAYHCEVAATLDYFLTGGKNAMPIEKGWWRKPIPKNQLEICRYCGVSHDLPAVRDTSPVEYMSWWWIDKLKPIPSAVVEVKSAADFPELHTPRHYAKQDGVHYWSKKNWRIWLLHQKRWGALYHWNKRVVWPIADLLERVFNE